ncbi:DEAD/DEAH box helicase [Cohnella zeiphila]|uniref:DEAD/DEAH box helicase n=1 Tax=Cohnella zeiphila TaxID=2761120 RepID=A0A7X0SKW8_9BACL|nr:DEAD/DEAH box helicase [Cohnella zeiphila]MBB6731821.1 DEAD/DEAH box helicase [Cohnella zeiphila]
MKVGAQLRVNVALSEYGDALIYGMIDDYDYVSGLHLKHLLFAWHEDSYYGTELAVQTVRDVEAVVLPAEMVVPFFAAPVLLRHIDWDWGDEASLLLKLAPDLAGCTETGKFAPDLDAFRGGELQWTWDDDALEESARTAVAAGGADESFLRGLHAAFSAAVSRSHYGTEAAAADLRREYPALFARDPASAAGMDRQAWLVAIGWKADAAPFRPALQLLEPTDFPEEAEPEAGMPGSGDLSDGLAAGWSRGAALDGEPEWRLRLVLQDKRDESAVCPVRLTADGTVLGTWPDAWTPFVRERAGGWLERLRAALPPGRLRLAGDGGDALGAPLDDEAAWRFLNADSRRLLDAGWQVLLPAWWEEASRKRPRLRAKIRSGPGSRSGRSMFGLDAIIDFDWRVAIGDADLTEAEFMDLAARNARLVRFRGRWIALDPALLAQIRRAMAGVDKSQGLSFQDVLQLHLLGAGDEGPDGGENGEELAEQAARVRIEVELNEHLAKLIGQLGRQSEWPRLEAPAGLRAELRSYQQEGFSWLALLGRFGLGACLADDMGLGKTVQLIAYLLHRRESSEAADDLHPALIVCPTSVLGNWQKELARFAPSLAVSLHYGGKRLAGESFADEARRADVVLTSYATASLDQEMLADFPWGVVCLDEAQNIKNAQTKQSAAVRSFRARHRIALTGTPIENRLAELWSIYDFINPGYLGSSRAFQERFAGPIEKDRDERRTADLQRLVKPFMLRRKKKDPAIQLDLPEKNEMKTFVNLTAEQGVLYDQTVNDLLERMKTLEGIERKGAILAALTRLKQLCDHPSLLEKDFSLPEPDAADEAAVAALVARSSKLERLLEMVREVRDEGERCLIFTQYIGMGEMLRTVLSRELEEPVLYLNGSVSKTARDQMIERFQSQSLPPGEQPGVFVLSLKAGGVGLNLTAANHVFHFDRWWNPAVENQATDRAYRMGQTRDVQVHKFISIGTLEERIDEMLESKQQLSDNVISSSEGWITELSTDELRELFTLRREWVR